MDKNNQVLLTDEQVQQFITDGFLILQTDFAPDFHESLMAQLNKVYEEEGNPGNNLLPRIRELQKVFDHPVITGALTSVLGPDYMLHAHRHGHFNANPAAGGWHKDSYWGYDRMRNHHPWWAMIMYFPQDTPPELGPTGIMPGTQNYETRIFAKDDASGEALASGGAGTFALIHYDIWHRSTPNILGHPRYMLKFEFMRTEAPAKPSWDAKGSAWSHPAGSAEGIPVHDRLWEESWNWLSGQLGSIAGSLPDEPSAVRGLAEKLEDAYEPDALNAAYALASAGEGGLQALLQALRHESTAVSRLAAYGLSVSGESAVPGLIAALDDARAATVIHAAFALGELRQLAAAAVSRLTALLVEASAEVRRTVVEALGMIGSGDPEAGAVQGLIQGLQDDDAQVRFMSGLALTRLGRSGEAAVPALERALDDENRYVRAHAAEALRYIGTPKAQDILIRELFRSRWCATTTKENAFYP
ncbi:HEAT repeat domain-containing protein [Paenibacillus filicis]|uniref:HEAT repeat domain-containing protein n=1 Tax=Paenibacillus filicis TaxID=669464 RepID=A0ABU9DM27_9BACL